MNMLHYLIAPCAVFTAIAIGPASAEAQTAPVAYAAVRTGQAKPGQGAELATRARVGAIPIVRGVPGFVAYYVILSEDERVTTVTVYADRAGAEESNRRMLPWIRANLADLLSGPPSSMEGPVVVEATR
jgi:hypothetical protein